jgi:hypothetical protein
MQKGIFPSMGVSRKLGNEGLTLINTTYAEDKELSEICKQFALKCSAAWVQGWVTYLPFFFSIYLYPSTIDMMALYQQQPTIIFVCM